MKFWIMSSCKVSELSDDVHHYPDKSNNKALNLFFKLIRWFLQQINYDSELSASNNTFPSRRKMKGEKENFSTRIYIIHKVVSSLEFDPFYSN